MRKIDINVVTASDGIIDKLPLGCHPTELPFFQKITAGGGVVLGYKTLHELSLIKNRNIDLLPGRRILVLTHEPGKMFRFRDCIAVTSVDEVIRHSRTIKLFISGGDSIFNEFINLPQIGAVHVAQVDVDSYGVKRFPELTADKWDICKKSGYHPAGGANKHGTRFTTYIPVKQNHD